MSNAGRTDGPAFELHQVGQTKAGRDILSDVTLAIPRGQITVLLGPSGAGKTSLLRLLNRLDEVPDGEIAYDGRPLASYPVTQLRRRVGFVSQTPVMFPGTVGENLRVAAEISEVPTGAFRDAALRALGLAELEESFLDREASELSVGQQQRVNLARTLISEPDVLLLDEPTAALDMETSESLLSTVRRLCRDEGLTVVLSTHRLQEAQEVGDQAVLLRDGAVERSGAAPHLLLDEGSSEHGAPGQHAEEGSY
jgi:ABC-type multidrug transport system ATPase subunit